MDPFMTEDEPLQLHMMEAWQERGKRALERIKASMTAPALVDPREARAAHRVFQFCGTQYVYWQQYGFRGEVK